jgi:hypothetical protein
MTPCPHCGHEQEEADGYTLVAYRGKKQKIIGDQVYCVEDRATPPKEPTTGTETG